MNKATEPKKRGAKFRLERMRVQEVSVVDHAANQRQFIVTKSVDEPGLSKAGRLIVPTQKVGATFDTAAIRAADAGIAAAAATLAGIRDARTAKAASARDGRYSATPRPPSPTVRSPFDTPEMRAIDARLAKAAGELQAYRDANPEKFVVAVGAGSVHERSMPIVEQRRPARKVAGLSDAWRSRLLDRQAPSVDGDPKNPGKATPGLITLLRDQIDASEELDDAAVSAVVPLVDALTAAVSAASSPEDLAIQRASMALAAALDECPDVLVKKALRKVLTALDVVREPSAATTKAADAWPEGDFAAAVVAKREASRAAKNPPPPAPPARPRKRVVDAL